MARVQPTLPFYTPRDRGKLYALRNILAAIRDELRTQAPVAQEVVKFAALDLRHILRKHTPLRVLSAHPTNAAPISPHPFEIHDLVPPVQGEPRPEVFATVADLARRLDIADLASLLQRRELIGIDESQVDSPLPHSALTFLKSVAFRMYHIPDHPPDEQAGPIVSEMRMKLAEDESFESQNKLISYIRNSFVGYVSALTALAFERNPYIVLHGPLVRAIRRLQRDHLRLRHRQGTLQHQLGGGRGVRGSQRQGQAGPHGGHRHPLQYAAGAPRSGGRRHEPAEVQRVLLEKLRQTVRPAARLPRRGSPTRSG